MFQDSLFSHNSQKDFSWGGGRLIYTPKALETLHADALFHQAKGNFHWQQSTITIAGQKHLIPRLNCWMGDDGAEYAYSGNALERLDWQAPGPELRELCEKKSDHNFNSVLANLYRDGQDCVGWHSDNEPELGLDPLIAVISLGGSRFFDIRSRENHRDKIRLELEHGSLLIMSGRLQHSSEHCIARSKKFCAPRISLTFRKVFKPSSIG